MSEARQDQGDAGDERVQQVSPLVQLLKRPELGALAGFVAVTFFFILVADRSMFSLAGTINFLVPAAQLGILAVAASVLMIGGEFDLSIGSMVAFSGFVFASCMVTIGLPLEVSILATFVAAVCVGLANGLIVLRTGLPSFIVTLAGLFILRGLSLVGLKWASNGQTQLRGVREASEGALLAPIFSGDAFSGAFVWLADNGYIETFRSGAPRVSGIPVEILWFILIALVATFVLLRTPFGNWIFAAGGDPNAALNSGVPVARVKITLFVFTACCATLVAIITVMDAGSTDARRGFQKEFEAIIAAVIGGTLLTGGYGSAIGAFIGAIIFGMVLIGLSFTDIDQDWYLVFLGTMLLIAVLLNNAVRKRITGGA